MELWAFWGCFLAVFLIAVILILRLRWSVRKLSRKVFGTSDILNALEALETEAESRPRSLNGCDSLLLPQILREIPDFDTALAKTYARNHLREKLGHHPGFTIHNVVMAQYLPSAAQKTIVYQAAVCWTEDGKCLQKRYELNYTYLMNQEVTSVAANCPNCGAALGYGETQCHYCDSRIANVMGNTWKFTELRED